MIKNKQEAFDICMAILFAAILLAISAWIAVDNTNKPYKNTLQHDIRRHIECEDK